MKQKNKTRTQQKNNKRTNKIAVHAHLKKHKLVN